jgi:plastocyanin
VKKLLALTAAGAVAAVLAVPALAATKTVSVNDNYFVRKGSVPTVRIPDGGTVKWVWHGKHKHNVFQIAGPGHFHSPSHAGSGTFKHRFTMDGTYVFQCTYHANMQMKVKVT